MDKLWIKSGQTLDKVWTLCPDFVRSPILLEHQDVYVYENEFLSNVTTGQGPTTEITRVHYLPILLALLPQLIHVSSTC